MQYKRIGEVCYLVETGGRAVSLRLTCNPSCKVEISFADLDQATLDLREAQQMLDAFRWVRAERLARPRRVAPGVCSLVKSNYFRDSIGASWRVFDQEHLWMLFISWKHFSGDLVYPVPGWGTPYEDPDQAFRGALRWDGWQGALRTDLVQHCIRVLEQLIPMLEAEHE